MVPSGSSTSLVATSALLVGLGFSGCNLLSVTEPEGGIARGPASFDPYSGPQSGAIALALQHLNGCSILMTGEPVAAASDAFPYPDECPDILADDIDDPSSMVPPSATMPLLAGNDYFLDHLSLMHQVMGEHDDFADRTAAARWFRRDSIFKSLDWSNFGLIREEFSPVPGAEGEFNRTVRYGNAQWMTEKDYSFEVAVIDETGTVREAASVVYNRSDFMASNEVGGHTNFAWVTQNVGAPESSNDDVLRPNPYGDPVIYRTIAKVDHATSTNPFKAITIPETLEGPGALRVTWSLMPNQPFYFPVTFVREVDAAQTCFDDNDEPVACDFGINPVLSFNEPANGEGYYEPGEIMSVFVEMEDGTGNRLHPSDQLPAFYDYYFGQSNGLSYFNPYMTEGYLDYNTGSGFKIAGPINKLVPSYDSSIARPYFHYPELEQHNFVLPGGLADIIPGAYETPLPTRYALELPQDAEPGTYVGIVRGNRQYSGERFARANAFFFQVGQAEPTSYPGRVGNCQICHRGVMSLDNVMHGLSVDHIEGCKTCHNVEVALDIHRIHFLSTDYPAAKNECTSCHLDRESAVRPSMYVCSNCHPQIHGGEYFEQQFAGENTRPNAFGNCAQACHVTQPPTAHILPPE